MTKIAIIQSNYIPWKGYFHIIQKVDHFVFLDSVKYTTRDWRNRNQIKTPSGISWLSVPTKRKSDSLIKDVLIDNPTNWAEKHFKTLWGSYKRTDYWELYVDFLESFLLKKKWDELSVLNHFLIRKISEMLKINTQFHDSSSFVLETGGNEKIISIVKQLNGDHYLTGPLAKAYIKPELFEKNGILLEYMDYPDYPEYKQPWGDFCHQVSILDLLFCTGPEATKFIWDY